MPRAVLYADLRRSPLSTLFPYTTLFRSIGGIHGLRWPTFPLTSGSGAPLTMPRNTRGDRKSTRLNSSHITTSYAVFGLKKKRRKVLGPPHDAPCSSRIVGGLLLAHARAH